MTTKTQSLINKTIVGLKEAIPVIRRGSYDSVTLYLLETALEDAQRAGVELRTAKRDQDQGGQITISLEDAQTIVRTNGVFARLHGGIVDSFALQALDIHSESFDRITRLEEANADLAAAYAEKAGLLDYAIKDIQYVRHNLAKAINLLESFYHCDINEESAGALLKDRTTALIDDNLYLLEDDPYSLDYNHKDDDPAGDDLAGQAK